MGIRNALLAILFLGSGLFIAGDKVIAEDRAVEKSVTKHYVEQDLKGLSSIHSLVFATAGEVRLEQGQSASLSVVATPDLLDRLKITIVDQRLVIGEKKQILSLPDKDRLIVNLVIPHPRGIEVNGSGHIATKNIESDALTLSVNGSGSVVTGRLTSSDVELRLNGSGAVKVDSIATKALKVHRSGAGELVANNLQFESAAFDSDGSGDISIGALSGGELVVKQKGSGDIFIASRSKTESLMIDLNGSGEYRAPETVSGVVEAVVLGSGLAEFAVTSRLDATVKGSGRVLYHGDPAQIKLSEKGSGEIKRVGN